MGKPGDYVARDEFIALCEQVARIAAELESRDRKADPYGPNGWCFRTSTEIKRRVREIAHTTAASTGAASNQSTTVGRPESTSSAWTER